MNCLEFIIKIAVEWIVVPVFNIVLVPLLQLIIETIKITSTLIFFNVGSFILALIDFIEGLFRVLCGLPSDKMTLTLGSDGGTGDILVQVIRSSEIQQAFLAMCIVGLFLLLITSVFQIIKVEYTTEGAKNSKTPILQKAFKSLANLMLLPLLVIFGIIIANGVLGILDKATTAEGDNPTISGLLFATGASEAHRPKDDDYYKMNSSVLIDAVPGILGYTIKSAVDTVLLILENGADIFSGDLNSGAAKEWIEGETKEYYNSVEKRADIEDMYISQDANHKYWNPIHVSRDFEIAEINYLIVILGGVVVLKAFFFTVFGLVIRLYKCATLFIIAPVVIGLTPMTEGGLGKWRQSFMGEVLGAYGTILSVNIFMIVIRVLINIQLNFTSAEFMFASSFMTFLLKSIIVIAGCLMIEKFSKELGGYFGAADAMGAGGGMAKEVGSTALKAGMAVAGAAVGGAALAGGVAKMGMGAVKGGVKAVGGIANKIDGGVGKAGRQAAKEAKAQGANKAQQKEASEKAKAAQREKLEAAKQDKFDLEKKAYGSGQTVGKYARNREKDAKALEYSKKLNNEQKSGLSSERDSLLAKRKELVDQANKEEDSTKKQKMIDEAAKISDNINGLDSQINNLDASNKAIDSVLDSKDMKSARSYAAKHPGARKVLGDTARKAAGSVAQAGMNAQSMFVGFGAKALDNIPGMKLLRGFKKDQEAGAAMLGADHEAALKAAQDKSKDRKQKILAGSLLGTTMMQNASRNVAVMETTQQLIKDAKIEQVNLESGALRALNSAIANSSAFNDMTKGEQAQYAMGLADKLGDMGAKIDAEEITRLVSAGVQQEKYDFQFNFDASAIERAVNEAMRKGGSAKDIEQSLKVLLDKQIADKNNLMVKKIEELLKKFQSELGGK